MNIGESGQLFEIFVQSIWLSEGQKSEISNQKSEIEMEIMNQSDRSVIYIFDRNQQQVGTKIAVHFPMFGELLFPISIRFTISDLDT
jgi:hypothetical protein